MSIDYITRTGKPFNRDEFDQAVKRKGYWWPSFSPYGAVKGLFDYGPPFEGLESHVINIWRDHFIRAEKMMALKCSMLTPYEVLKTSGHVDRFADFMCKDPSNGEILRTDHLIKDVLKTRLDSDREARGETLQAATDDPKKKKKAAKLAKTVVKLDDSVRQEYEHALATLDDFTGDTMGQFIQKHDIRNPTTDHKVEPPVSVNLMFQTQIGATGKEPAFLRPETAQGQFLSFQKLVEYGDSTLPFASASIGYSFRNELSPRASLLRVREFLMAEIEHFVDPDGGKKHPKFHLVRDVQLPLLSRTRQEAGNTSIETLSIGHAVDSGLVDNETLGYFLVRIYQFMQRIGIDMQKLRFRQHMQNEMAHYACDCWDCELLNSFGWTECVGCADRSAYDLDVHKKATGQPLHMKILLKEPYEIEEWQPEFNLRKFGPKYKKDAKAVEAAISALSQDMREKMSISLEKDGKADVNVPGIPNGSVEVDNDVLSMKRQKRMERYREILPNVIEPSFGIGRILYSLMEHCFWTREGGDKAEGDPERNVVSFDPQVAPIKVLVVPLQRDARFGPLISSLESLLDTKSISFKLDTTSVSIGRRYARNDELGIPFGITVDYETIEDGTVTLRDRDSTKQVRAPQAEIVKAINRMIKGKENWEDVVKRLPVFASKDA